MKIPDWSKMDCGLFHVPFFEAERINPEISDILWALSGSVDDFKPDQWIIDLKIHMLMPNQYPCITNWHYDFIPRNDDNEQDFSKICPGEKMYLWLSGPPLTEFEDGRKVKPCSWIEFEQMDLHRGTKSEEFCWRAFFRAWRNVIADPAPRHMWKRRHTQIYLDAKNFIW